MLQVECLTKCRRRLQYCTTRAVVGCRWSPRRHRQAARRSPAAALGLLLQPGAGINSVGCQAVARANYWRRSRTHVGDKTSDMPVNSFACVRAQPHTHVAMLALVLRLGAGSTDESIDVPLRGHACVQPATAAPPSVPARTATVAGAHVPSTPTANAKADTAATTLRVPVPCVRKSVLAVASAAFPGVRDSMLRRLAYHPNARTVVLLSTAPPHAAPTDARLPAHV